MKRILAICVLAVGIAPSIPVFNALARVPRQDVLVRECKDKLGFGQTQPLHGAEVLALRRCLDSAKEYYREARFEVRLLPVSHYQSTYERLQAAVATRRESRRSLNARVEFQKDIREDYYTSLTIGERDLALQQHREDRRTQPESPQAYVLRAVRAKQAEWRNAIRSCVYYPREQRQECVYINLAL